MDGLLAGQVAVVTGGSSGNGRAICRRFAEHGADVVVADVRETPREGGVPTAELLAEETDAAARFVECDVSDPDAFDPAMEHACELGGLDVMVNNAGIVRSERFFDVTPAELDAMFDVNVNGVFFGCQAAARAMIEDGAADTSKSIINVSSLAAIEGYFDQPSYCASKGAVRSLTSALADRLGREGIRVNALHPGVIDTAMTTEDVELVGTDAGETYEQSIPAGRFGVPEDVAGATLFLASELASYVTGESLLVDGGIANTG